MKLTAIILCDHAAVRENLLYVLGGGITQLRRSSVPAPMDVMLALMLSYERAEIGSKHTIDIAIREPEKPEPTPVAQARMTLGSFPADQPSPQIPVVLSFAGSQLPSFGQYEVTISLDGEDQPSGGVTFAVVQVPGDNTLEPSTTPDATSGQPT